MTAVMHIVSELNRNFHVKKDKVFIAVHNLIIIFCEI
jgi:hypothetical protein